mmetsp:Transcript_31626/g.104629  ORF Transcript_31626/g.104629 Transcript_31626/m.104629 type:complete len:529 (+) Transcript_31626:298-1884(+)
MEDQELGGQMLTLENENGVRQAGVIETRVMPQAWEGYYEGYFMLKNHGHEQRIFESFAVWRSEKVSTFSCENGGQFFDADATLPSTVDAVAWGMGRNAYGKFFLRGATFLDGCLRLERLYALNSDKKRARQTGLPRDRRFLVPLVSRSSTREKRPPTQFDNSAPSPGISTSCDESPKRGRDCKGTFSLGEFGDDSLSDKDGNEVPRDQKPGPSHDHVQKRRCDACAQNQVDDQADSSDELSSEDEDEMPESNWRAAFIDEDSDEIYEGCVCPITGLRHGLGAVVHLAHGHRIYEGEWRHGREHGRGILFSRDRTTVYDGEFADGKLHGRGTYYLPSGAVYSGEFRENMKHGFGRYVLSPNSSGYVGEWRENARHGRGRFEASDSSSYDGEWAFDKRNGKATLDLSNGTIYDGHWTEGTFEGRGSCIHSDGNKYEGMWRSGKKDGRGSIQWPNGASYEGRFRDDKIDGQGALLVPKPVSLAENINKGFHRDHPDKIKQLHMMHGWLLPIKLKADMTRVHLKAGFDEDGQ